MAAANTVTTLSRILVVDDEPLILQLVKTALHAPGLYVITCDGGHKAMLILEEYKSGIAVVLSDVRMPGMSGPQLIRKVIEKSPNTAVALMSGGTREEVIDPKIPLLKKPFNLVDLRVLIDQLITRQQRIVSGLQTQLMRNSNLATEQSRIVKEVQALAKAGKDRARI